MNKHGFFTRLYRYLKLETLRGMRSYRDNWDRWQV
jgi:hypothetical protein